MPRFKTRKHLPHAVPWSECERKRITHWHGWAGPCPRPEAGAVPGSGPRRGAPGLRGARVRRGQHRIGVADELLAAEAGQDHVDVADDAAQARIRLARRRADLQHEAVHLVDHEAHAHLRRARPRVLPSSGQKYEGTMWLKTMHEQLAQDAALQTISARL